MFTVFLYVLCIFIPFIKVKEQIVFILVMYNLAVGDKNRDCTEHTVCIVNNHNVAVQSFLIQLDNRVL
jgi:hypothetical protein